MTVNPGDNVTCDYRDGFGYVGTVLASDDPAAWRGTLALPDGDPDPAAVRAHVERCRVEFSEFDEKVPVQWPFGRVYWERVDWLHVVDASRDERERTTE